MGICFQAILQKGKDQRGSSAENKLSEGRAQKTQIKLAKKESEVISSWLICNLSYIWI